MKRTSSPLFFGRYLRKKFAQSRILDDQNIAGYFATPSYALDNIFERSGGDNFGQKPPSLKCDVAADRCTRM